MKLKEFLEQSGLKKKYFADRIGVTPTHLSRLFKGSSRPSFETMIRIEKETGGKVTYKDFITKSVGD